MPKAQPTQCSLVRLDLDLRVGVNAGVPPGQDRSCSLCPGLFRDAPRSYDLTVDVCGTKALGRATCFLGRAGVKQAANAERGISGVALVARASRRRRELKVLSDLTVRFWLAQASSKNPKGC